MNTVTVNASKSYNVHIGSNLLPQLGKYIGKVHSICKVAVISDSNVWPLYGESALRSLGDSGYEAVHYILPAGEESKNPQQYISILNFLSENAITRSDLLIALGGGVVGDKIGRAHV